MHDVTYRRNIEVKLFRANTVVDLRRFHLDTELEIKTPEEVDAICDAAVASAAAQTSGEQ